MGGKQLVGFNHVVSLLFVKCYDFFITETIFAGQNSGPVTSVARRVKCAQVLYHESYRPSQFLIPWSAQSLELRQTYLSNGYWLDLRSSQHVQSFPSAPDWPSVLLHVQRKDGHSPSHCSIRTTS
jgi:hypothetical protein